MIESPQTHEVSIKAYASVWAALLVLLGMTIAIAKLDLLSQFSVVASLCIASVKAGLVLIYFMHLKYEGRIVKGMLALAVGSLTFIIMLTFADVWYR